MKAIRRSLQDVLNPLGCKGVRIVHCLESHEKKKKNENFEVFKMLKKLRYDLIDRTVKWLPSCFQWQIILLIKFLFYRKSNHKTKRVCSGFEFKQRFAREKEKNGADLCLRSIVLSFESGCLWCSISVVKMAVRF